MNDIEKLIGKPYLVAAVLFSLVAVFVAANAMLDVKKIQQQAGYPVDYASSGGGCGGGSGGGGCGAGSVPKDPKELEVIKSKAKNYYISKYGDGNISVDLADKGCHLEIAIIKDSKPVKYLSYRNGAIEEIS